MPDPEDDDVIDGCAEDFTATHTSTATWNFRIWTFTQLRVFDEGTGL